ncbi:MAG: alpha/beta hydrolase, partial [Candidatus Melainabacteria bacterium]|nr:alpha/beta hydrolase [Candidatus Melainabacteria bacterium]
MHEQALAQDKNASNDRINAEEQPASTRPPEKSTAEILRSRNFEVFYATTRANEGSTYKPVYAAKRNLDLGAGSLEYGACQIERPRSAPALMSATNFPQFKLSMETADRDWQSAPAKRFDRLTLPDFLVKVKNWRGPIMVFIHGYDESFDKSLKDAAMIAYQFDSKGDAAVLPIAFSWPSLNNKADYAADEANLEWSTAAFFEFLDTLKAAKNPASPLDIVAHSMGNRPLIQYCFQRKTETPGFRNIILSGADVDYHMAESRIGGVEAAADRSVTVLVSDRDAPLITSQLLHGQPRLGRPIDPPTVRADKADLLSSAFWSRLTLDASAIIVPNALNMDADVVRWINQNPELAKEFGEKTIFIDVTNLVTGELGHRLAYPVIAGILRETLSPLSSTVVYKRPDKLTLGAMGGSPRWLYR